MLIILSCTRSALLTGYIYTSTIVNIPIRGQIVNVLSAVQASIRLLPLLGASAIGSFVAGVASFRKNNTFWTLNIACCFMMLGSGLSSTLDVSVYTQAKQYGYEVLLGFGIGLTFSTTTIIAGLNTQFIHHGMYLHPRFHFRGERGATLASFLTRLQLYPKESSLKYVSSEAPSASQSQP